MTAEEALDHPWLNNLCPEYIKKLKKQNEVKIKTSNPEVDIPKLNVTISNDKINTPTNEKSPIGTPPVVTFLDKPPQKTPTTSTATSDNTKLNHILKDENMVNEPRIMSNYAKGGNAGDLLGVPVSDNGSSTAYVGSQQEDNTSNLPEGNTSSALEVNYPEIGKSNTDSGVVYSNIPEHEPTGTFNKNSSTHSLPNKTSKLKSTLNKLTDTKHMSLAFLGHTSKSSSRSSSTPYSVDEDLEIPELYPDEFYIANTVEEDKSKSKKKKRKHKKSEHEKFLMDRKLEEETTTASGEVVEVRERSVPDPTESLESAEAIYTKSNPLIDDTELPSTTTSNHEVATTTKETTTKEKEGTTTSTTAPKNEINIVISTVDSVKDLTTTTDATTAKDNQHIRNLSIHSDSTCSCCKTDGEEDEEEGEEEKEDDNLPNLLQFEGYKTNLSKFINNTITMIHVVNCFKSYSQSSFESSSIVTDLTNDEKLSIQSSDRPIPKPVDKLTIKPLDKPTTKPLDKPTTKPLDKPTTKPLDKPTDN